MRTHVWSHHYITRKIFKHFSFNKTQRFGWYNGRLYYFNFHTMIKITSLCSIFFECLNQFIFYYQRALITYLTINNFILNTGKTDFFQFWFARFCRFRNNFIILNNQTSFTFYDPICSKDQCKRTRSYYGYIF